jgi:hypothetical protein
MRKTGVGSGAELGSITLAHPLRWRLTNAGVEKGAGIGSLTPAHPLRWRLTDGGVDTEAKLGSITLATCLGSILGIARPEVL